MNHLGTQPGTQSPKGIGLAGGLDIASIIAQLGLPFLEALLAPSFQEQLSEGLITQGAQQRGQLPFLRAQAKFPGFGQKEKLPGQLRQQDLANLASSLGIGQTLQGQQKQRQFQGDILSSLRGLA